MTERRFPPPWSVDDPDMKLGQTCYIVRDADGHALAYVYFEDEPGRRSAAASAWPFSSLTMKQASVSSTDQGSGKRRLDI